MPVKINGSTSGSVTLAAPATGSDVTLTLPGSSVDLAAIPQGNVANLTSDLAAKAANPSLTIVNSGGTALTGAATITVNLSGKNFIHVWVDSASSASASSVILIRFNADSGSNYLRSYVGVDSTTLIASGGSDTGISLGRMGNSAANAVTGHAFVLGANGTGYKPYSYSGYGSGTTTNLSYAGTGLWGNASAVTSVSLVSTVGNFDAGTIYVYAG